MAIDITDSPETRERNKKKVKRKNKKKTKNKKKKKKKTENVDCALKEKKGGSVGGFLVFLTNLF